MPDPEAFDHPVHFTDLDGLRGLLALSVVLLHYGINSAVQRLSHGHLVGFTFQLSVDFFFILSGFVLAYSMRRGRPSLGAFALKRVFRLVPVHYVCLAALLAMSIATHLSVPYLPKPLAASTIAGDFALATPVVWPSRDSVNVPSWSVAWELYLPIVALMAGGLVLPAVRRSSAVLVLLGCCGLSVAAVGVAQGGHLYGIRAGLGLATGACLFAAWSVGGLPRRPMPGLLYALIAAMGGVMLASASYPLVAATFPWVAVATVVVGTRTRSLLSTPPIAWLGRISYTLYMVHVPVLVAVLLVAGDRINNSLTLKGATVALAMLAATALSRWVERPAMEYGRRLRSAPTAE
jgi:peptidoglycan/LPS O-acetylase OafA/YrhL